MYAYNPSYRKRWLLPFLLAAGCWSCKKFVQLPPPDTQLDAALLYSNDQTATDAMMGIYSNALKNAGYFLNGGNSLYPGLSSDEFTGTIAAPQVDVFVSNTIPSDNTFITTLYATAYADIYDANSMLWHLQEASGLTAGMKDQLRGEALCLRALIYFHLADLFGALPLITSPDYEISAIAPRSSVDSVYRQVQSDLLTADSLLDTDYTVSPAYPSARTRPNKWAVRALEARLYLYQGDWQAAEAAATAVIDAGLYRLEPSLDSVFLITSREAIWQLQPVNAAMNSAEGYWFVPADGSSIRPAYTLTKFLLNAFAAGDRRRTIWTGTRTVSGIVYTYPFKYKVRTGIYPCKEGNTVLRLAETYLIRAEARARENKLSEAIADLNIIRSRAGIDDLATTLTQAQVLMAVYQERRVELFAEWGHRWSDLKRTGQAAVVLGTEKSQWDPDAALYPIPLMELQRNPHEWQNPGY